MSSWVRRIASAAILAALILAASGSSEKPTFSRSRWISERRHLYLFSDGVLPAEGPLPESVIAPGVAGIGAEAKKGRATQGRVSQDILEPDGGPGQAETEAEPYLAVDPENDLRLLASYQEGRFADGGARSLTWAFSKNGGRKWSEGAVPGLTHSSGGDFEKTSDPWVAYGPGGRAYLASIRFNETRPENGIYVSASEDGGRNWGPPVAVHLGDINNFDDKEAVVVDTQEDSPFRGRVYVAWDTVGPTAQTLRVAWSDDGGQSFSPAVDVERTGANIGVIPLVGPGGVLHLVWMHATGVNNLTVVASRSENGGATWSPLVQVGRMENLGVDQLRTGELPAAAVDARSGRLYVVWPDVFFRPGDFIGPDEVALSRSDDGGRTWSAKQRVSGDEGFASFTPAVAVDGKGRVGVSYYANQGSDFFQVDHYVAISADGETFGAARRTSRPSFDARFAAVTDRGFFLGDYQGLAAGKDAFYALWVGTIERSVLHKGEKQPDVFVSKVK
ncbi:MAG: sialidase family protein [Thermoanaerobaculia bacterium]